MINAKYQVMRALTAEEYGELKEAIRENGVVVPIVCDEQGNVIDGHHRKMICDELGLTGYPVDIRRGLGEEEKIALAKQLNEARRQLTPDEKRREIRRILQETPEISDRQIAKQVGASPTTVGAQRQELESIVQIGQCDRQTSDGRVYPAQRRAASKEPPPIDEEETVAGEDYKSGDDYSEPIGDGGAKVVSLAGRQRSKEREEYERYIDGGNRHKELEKAIEQAKKLKFADSDIADIVHWLSDPAVGVIQPMEETLQGIREAMSILDDIHTKLIKEKGAHDAKNRNQR